MWGVPRTLPWQNQNQRTRCRRQRPELSSTPETTTKVDERLVETRPGGNKKTDFVLRGLADMIGAGRYGSQQPKPPPCRPLVHYVIQRSKTLFLASLGRRQWVGRIYDSYYLGMHVAVEGVTCARCFTQALALTVTFAILQRHCSTKLVVARQRRRQDVGCYCWRELSSKPLLTVGKVNLVKSATVVFTSKIGWHRSSVAVFHSLIDRAMMATAHTHVSGRSIQVRGGNN